MPRLAGLLRRRDGVVQCCLQGRIDERGRYGAVLHLEATLGLTCDRCGAVFDWPLEASTGFFFVADQAELDAIPVDAEGDEPLVGSRHFDLAELAEDQVILSLPISPRHERCQTVLATDSDRADLQRPFAGLEVLKKSRTL